MPAVLFVCLANICRSPAGAGILSHLAKDMPLTVDSCGVGNWYVGEKTDPRMQAAALRRGIVLPARAKLFQSDYFDQFDLILPVDHQVLYELYQKGPSPQQKTKIHLATVFSSSYHNEDIPDPFYSDEAGFDLVLDMLEDACEGVLLHLRDK